jgi:glycosyltransferase involved in cell wall biosynthesis
MLEGWSLEHKALKKKIAWFLYQQKDLADAYVFCATSLKEAESIRNLGFKQPIAVIPNGVDLPDLASDIETKKEVYNLLFFSRLNPKKGVLDLIEAWHRLKETNIFKGNSWKLKIVGPDEQGYKKIIVGTIKKYHIEDDITIADAVYGKEKFKLFNQSDIFILPTYSENFGNVIVEALAAGVPVITTKGAPWSELVTNRCGWWTEIGTEGCYDALRMAITTTAMERREMGQRGRRLVETMYSWPTVAMKTAKFYQWILHGGAKPEFIY